MQCYANILKDQNGKIKEVLCDQLMKNVNKAAFPAAHILKANLCH